MPRAKKHTMETVVDAVLNLPHEEAKAVVAVLATLLNRGEGRPARTRPKVTTVSPVADPPAEVAPPAVAPAARTGTAPQRRRRRGRKPAGTPLVPMQLSDPHDTGAADPGLVEEVGAGE